MLIETNTQRDRFMTARIWQLIPYGNNKELRRSFIYHVLTPEPVEQARVQAAWAYALRHTAKGLDLPDHDAAIALMLERHPSWQLIEGRVGQAPVAMGLADQDEPENK